MVVACIACYVLGVLNTAVLSRPGGQGFGGERLLFLATDILLSIFAGLCGLVDNDLAANKKCTTSPSSIFSFLQAWNVPCNSV